MTIARDWLEHYRTGPGLTPEGAAALEGFNTLTYSEKLELLFWMMMGSNNIITDIAKSVGIQIKHDVKPPSKN